MGNLVSDLCGDIDCNRQPPSRMRSLVLVGCVAAVTIGASACRPHVTSHTHLVFDASGGLEVLARSSNSPDTQGAELQGRKADMPLKLRLSRPTYTLLFDTPLQISPVVFLSARNSEGASLEISGAHVRRVHPESAAELDGFGFSFYVQEAKGEPLRITIADSSGKVLGSEVLTYKIVSHGHSYGVEGV